jgi:hypothetical protein
MGRLGQLPAIVLGGRASVRHAPEGASRSLRRHDVENRALTDCGTETVYRVVELAGL